MCSSIAKEECCVFLLSCCTRAASCRFALAHMVVMAVLTSPALVGLVIWLCACASVGGMVTLLPLFSQLQPNLRRMGETGQLTLLLDIVASCLQQHPANQEDAYVTDMIAQLRLLLDFTPALRSRKLIQCKGLVSALLNLGEAVTLPPVHLSVWRDLLCWFPLWSTAPTTTQLQLLEVSVWPSVSGLAAAYQLPSHHFTQHDCALSLDPPPPPPPPSSPPPAIPQRLAFEASAKPSFFIEIGVEYLLDSLITAYACAAGTEGTGQGADEGEGPSMEAAPPSAFLHGSHATRAPVLHRPLIDGVAASSWRRPIAGRSRSDTTDTDPLSMPSPVARTPSSASAMSTSAMSTMSASSLEGGFADGANASALTTLSNRRRLIRAGLAVISAAVCGGAIVGTDRAHGGWTLTPPQARSLLQTLCCKDTVFVAEVMVLIRRLVQAEASDHTLSAIAALEAASNGAFVPFLLVGPGGLCMASPGVVVVVVVVVLASRITCDLCHCVFASRRRRVCAVAVSSASEIVRAEAVRVVGLVLSTRTFRQRRNTSVAPLGILRRVARRATTITR